MGRVNVIAALYALLAALTGLSLGGGVELRAARPAVAASVSVAQVVATRIVRRVDPVAGIRQAPSLALDAPGAMLALVALPIDRIPARRRE